MATTPDIVAAVGGIVENPGEVLVRDRDAVDDGGDVQSPRANHDVVPAVAVPLPVLWALLRRDLPIRQRRENPAARLAGFVVDQPGAEGRGRMDVCLRSVEPAERFVVARAELHPGVTGRAGEALDLKRQLEVVEL